MKIKLLLIFMGIMLVSSGIYAQDSKENKITINTGFGTPGRFSDAASVKVPIHITYEHKDLFSFLPEFIYVGGYIRYTKINYDFDYWGNLTFTLVGFGERTSADIAGIIDEIAGEEIMPRVLALYGGVQIGYDYIALSDDNYNSHALDSEARIEPFLGVGLNLGQTFGLHMELGNTSTAIVTFGADLKF